MRKIRLVLKIVAFSLAIVFIVQILPLSTISTAVNNAAVIEQSSIESVTPNSPEIIGEVVSLRDEYTKHFRCEDGSFVATVYNTPVHYQEDGEWKEIDNTLVANSNTAKTTSINNAKYTVTKTSTPITFPENINGGKISITNGDNIITFGVKNDISIASSNATVLSPEELVSTSISSLQSEETSLNIEENNMKIAVDTQKSAITYENVFNNASLEYEVSSSIIKESIVILEKSDNYRYEFSIDFGNYIPEKGEDGGIYIYETVQSSEPIMAILPPYMFDADNDTSDAVTMDLVQNKSDYTLVVEADESWINSIFRKFPVVIDPTIILDINRGDIENVHVNQNYPNSNLWNSWDYQLEVGRNGNNVYRTYIKYNLPELPDCSIVTDAELILTQNWERDLPDTALYLNVYQCNSEWNDDSITWNNQPIQNLANATVVDYTNYKNGMSAEYNLNITKIVKDWYENGENYGLMLASSDESVEEKTSFYASRNIAELFGDVKPAVMVSYVNNAGVEDYWTYEGFSLGKSGSAYINTYNGALTYVHSDVSTNGLIAPVGVSHIYSTDDRYSSGVFDNMKFGKGFKLNVIEKIEAVNSSQLAGYPYKYIDGDGTVHFFKQDSTGCYYEFGSDIRLTSNSNGYIISFSDGSRKEFNKDGYLIKTTDNNGNTNTVTYENKRITKVTDGCGMEISLSYNGDNTLKHIADAAGRKTCFYYTNDGFLESITYPDGTETLYEYNSDEQLSKIVSFDGMQATINYKKINCPGAVFHKVTSFATYGKNLSNYDTISFEYRTSDTVISNTKGDEVVLAFDNFGRVINCIRNGETVEVSEYVGINPSGSNNSFNKSSLVSKSFTPKENVGSHSYSKVYYATTDSKNDYHEIQSEIVYNQLSAAKIGIKENVEPNSSYLYRGILADDFKTFSFSVYVNIVDTLTAGSVYMKVEAFDRDDNLLLAVRSKEITTTDNKWEMLWTTMTLPENSYNCRVSYGLFDGNGIVYTEALYYIEDDVAGNLNFLSNSSFEGIHGSSPFYGWSGILSPVIVETTNPVDGSMAARFNANPNEERELSQDFYINGKAGDVLVYGASAQALCSSSGNNNGDAGRFFGVRIYIYNDNELLLKDYVKFNEDAFDTMQTVMASVVAPQDYDEVDFEMCYNYEINTAIFDNAFVYRDNFGTYYEYDSNGRTVSARDDNGNEVNYSYTGADLTQATVKANGVITESASYAYDANHNLLSSAGIDGVEVSYVYPESGNKGLPLTVTVSDATGASTSTTSYEYYDNYSYIKKITDASGAVTQYDYDTEKGLVTKVTDPNGNVTEYEYDSDNDLLLSVSNPSAALENPSTEFVYDSSNQLTLISNDEISYYMSYDNFGRMDYADTSYCSSFLINIYDDESNITQQLYGMEGYADFTYDDDGRLKSESYDGTLAYEYDYSTKGILGRITDHENNTEWNYTYDLAGRLTDISSDNGKKISYGYNSQNQLGNFSVRQNNSVLLDTEYIYDTYGRVSGTKIQSMSGSPSQSYTYDTLGRTNKISNEYAENSVVSQNYSYKVNGTNQTGRVHSVSYSKTTESGIQSLVPTLSCDYDANGNITNVYENSVLKIRYHYDGLNRLVREDNSDIDKTVVYNYDRFGNILSKVECALTFGELGTAINTIPYEYNSGSSPDAVTKYGGETIHYDTYGNALSYRGYTLTWAKARQLSTMTDGETSLSFKYDFNGIRTKKTVNGIDTEYFYVGDTLVSQKTGNEIINFAYTAGGAPYGFTYNGTSYFYLTNIQGDIIGIYDSNGNVVVEYTYDSWGKLISITGSLASTIGVKNPLRYRGYYYDTETSLYYLQSRYYDPEIGRFINMDAYFIAGNDYIQGTNMYAYCYNNPVMYSDPSGMAGEFWSFLSELISGLFKKRDGKVEESFATIWMMYLSAIDNIGIAFYDGELESLTATKYPSGVVKVVIEIFGSLKEGEKKDSYRIEMFYGTGASWGDENKYYSKKQDGWDMAMNATSFLIDLLCPGELELLIKPIGFFMPLVEDNYGEFVLEMVDYVTENPRTDTALYFGILRITDSGGNEIFSFGGV